MHTSLRQQWTILHVMALALIMMAAFFAALVALPLPDVFLGYALYYFAIVPYAFTRLLFASVMQDPHALPSYNVTFFITLVFCALVIYSFFFAVVMTFISKKKVIPMTYVGLYVILTLVFDKLFSDLF